MAQNPENQSPEIQSPEIQSPEIQSPEAQPPPIPSPCELAPAIPFTETDTWFACGPGVEADQGWKLYVSCTLLNAAEILAVVVPLLHRQGLHFKYIKNLDLLEKLNAGLFGYPQIGKSLAIYFPTIDETFLHSLRERLLPFASTSPQVPFARPLAGDLPLYYRYGAYRSDTVEIGSEVLEDRRNDRRAAVPEGIEDELAPLATAPSENPAMREYLCRYPVVGALAQQGKAGVFLALDIASETCQEVVLKMGYHRGQLQADGTDGCALVRREHAFYRLLEKRGIGDVGPCLLDASVGDRHAVLTLEYIRGADLFTRLREEKLGITEVEAAWKVLRRIHQENLFVGDAKIGNFLVSDDGVMRAIDFETGGLVGETPVLRMRSFLLRNPCPEDPRDYDLAHFLTSILYRWQEEDRDLSRRRVDLRAYRQREPRNEIEAWALAKLAELTA